MREEVAVRTEAWAVFWIAVSAGSAAPAMLHGAVAFLVAVVVLVALGSLGGVVFEGWYVGLSQSGKVPATGQAVDSSAAKAAANGALAAATALPLGLAGNVIGGWAGSGEPMNYAPCR